MESEILDIWIVNKDTGVILLHRNYSEVELIKSELFGSILSAIFNWNFSDDPDEQEGIKSIELGDKALHFSLEENSILLIIGINVSEGFDQHKLMHLFDVIIKKFAEDGWYEKVNDIMLDTDEYNKFIPVLDSIVKDFEDKLKNRFTSDVQLSIKEILLKVANGEMEAKAAADLIEKLKKS
ncbi:MAG: hypothetical protein EAX96_11415 [Candidatus Lokiarchaeota archaeon]|nr:hypothetical protein [Candidatus Lokiarchaeota archaeon]